MPCRVCGCNACSCDDMWHTQTYDGVVAVEPFMSQPGTHIMMLRYAVQHVRTRSKQTAH